MVKDVYFLFSNYEIKKSVNILSGNKTNSTFYITDLDVFPLCLFGIGEHMSQICGVYGGSLKV